MPIKVRASSLYGEINALHGSPTIPQRQQFPLRKETNDIITRYSGTNNLVLPTEYVSEVSKNEIIIHSKFYCLKHGTCCSGQYSDLKWNLLL